MANPLKIRFTDGTFISVLAAANNPVYNDSWKAEEQMYYHNTIQNAAITFANMRDRTWNPPFSPTVSKYDEAGNRWDFTTDATRLRIKIYSAEERLLWDSGEHVWTYDGTQGWIFYFILGDTLDQAGNYQIYLKQARNSMAYSDSGREPDLDIRAAYDNGVNGNHEFSHDLSTHTPSTSKRIFLSNFVTGSDGFVSIVNVYYNRDATRMLGSENLITDVTDATSTDSQHPLNLDPEHVYPDPNSNDPYAEIDGESDLDGDLIPIPNLPPESATSTGIIGLFAPSHQQMQDLADFMWTDFGGQGTTVIDVLEELVEAIKRSISNPLDYVLGLNLIPSQGLSVGAAQVIRFGFVSSGVSMPRLTSQYFVVDCGSLSFDALCGDTFLDYAPYSKFSIYLPFVGFREVDANDFVGHTIGVVYHGDVVTGGVTAYVTKDGSVMYQYSGCCALNIPLSSDNWGSTIAATVQIATGMITGGAAAGAAGVAQAAAEGAARVAGNPSLLSPQVAHSGAVSGGAGAMGVLTPFVIREAVRFHSTENFNSVSGYPAVIYSQLLSLSGFTKLLDVHLHDIPATQGEIDEIEAALREGVIL